jgi:uncharacterized protein (DUF302 family)
MEAMFIEHQSRYPYQETMATLAGAVQAGGWRLLVSHDLQAILDGKGYKVLPVTVMEICNAKHSSRLLAGDGERTVASLMPCRVAVYEKSDGKTYVSRMNAEMFAQMLGGLTEEVMGDAFREMEVMLRDVIL